jgi:GNAT superfamily N-acetyltransferase
MEVELLWPLIQELVGESPISEEDWAFLKQSAEPLECPEPVVQALIGVRQNAQRPEVTERLRALTAFIEALGSNASRKLSFILELTEYLHLPVEIVQVLIQVPRKPVLPFLSRLWRALPRTGERAVYEEWFHGVAGELGLKPEMRRALIGLLEAVESKQPGAALRSLWSFLLVLPALPEPALEKSYLMDLAREARLSDALVKGMEAFIRLREKRQSLIASLGEVIRGLLEKGALGPEDHELLALLAGEGGISMSLLQAMIDIEEAIRAGEGRKGSGRFAAEVLEPFLREVLSAHLESESWSYIEDRARRLGLTSAQLEAIIELEKRLGEKSAKFPQHIQPLIHALVEKGEISDEKLLYLARKAQEMGGSEKVVRTLVQIEITAQRKAARSSPLQPPSAEPASISAESAEPPQMSPPTTSGEACPRLRPYTLSCPYSDNPTCLYCSPSNLSQGR